MSVVAELKTDAAAFPIEGYSLYREVLEEALNCAIEIMDDQNRTDWAMADDSLPM